MKSSMRLMAIGIPALLALYSCQKGMRSTEQPNVNERVNMLNAKPNNAVQGTVTVFATGFNNPRGLKFGPDGNLYVAEGGTGGTNSTIGQCTQVVPAVGPYTGSATGGRISMVNAAGTRTTITDNLPSSTASALIGGFISGVADVAFIENTLYALLAGGGCSHGVPTVPNGIVKVNADGSWSWVANLSDWSLTQPVAQPEAGDYEPDGTWYSMVSVRGDLYALEPNHGELVKVTTGGDISRVIDISASQGHNVPTALTYKGNFYMGNLDIFPIPAGASKIYKITPSGEIKVVAEGLNAVLGLVVDDRNRMYVLEMTVGADFPTPDMGRVVQIDPAGKTTVVASGLSLPTAMTMGPDGNLYVSNWGFGPPAVGGGQVLKITLTH
jgi:hypothetical protein